MGIDSNMLISMKYFNTYVPNGRGKVGTQQLFVCFCFCFFLREASTSPERNGHFLIPLLLVKKIMKMDPATLHKLAY